MATVTELVDLICEDTGLDATDERSVALSRLNHAARQFVQQVGGLSSTLTVSGSSIDSLDVSDTATYPILNRFIALDYVLLRDAGGEAVGDPLPQTTTEAVLAEYDANRTRPTEYAFDYPTLRLDAPSDAAGSVEFGLRVGPLEFVESGATPGTSEDVPTCLHAIWHERILASLACVLILERYEGREQDAAYHRTLFTESLAEYRKMMTRMGGRSLPEDDYGMTMFEV